MEQKVVATAQTKDGQLFDGCYTWETAQTLANEGYTIVAVADDGHMSKEDIQKLCDAELERAIDCFGEGHRK